MAYTIVPTITSGDLATATWGNTYIKNNFAAGVPDIFTTDGDMAVATGANAAERVAVMNGSNLLRHEVGGIEADISGVTTGGIIVGQSSGVLGLETPMTEAHAIAGTDTQVRGVTAERIKQAIGALAGSKIIHKSSAQNMDQTSTTLQNVTDFVFAIGVDETWVVYMSLRLSIWANANANIAWVLPADCAMTMSVTFGVIIPGSFVGGGETQTPGGPVTLDAASDTGHWAIVRCVFRNSDTESGNAQFKMCQQSPQSNYLTIKEDSYMMAFIQPA